MDKYVYKKKLLSILHDDIYNEMLSFWKLIEESVYDYKIFVSKKCFVLYKVFLPLFDFDIYKSCIKITDTAIPMYVNQMRGKKVLIIDDVFIHGRTALKISREIGQKAKKVDFYVFAKNSKGNEVQDINTESLRKSDKRINLARNKTHLDMFNKLWLSMQECLVKGYVECNEYQWKRISDMIMKCFWAVNMPYVSYVPVINLYEKDRLFKESILKDAELYNTHRQVELQQHFSYCVESTQNNNEAKSIIHYCFIISQNNFMENTKLVPMVFFDCENTNINKKFIVQSIRVIYQQDADDLFNYFLDYGNNNGLLSLHKYLLFSVGYLAARRWLRNNGINKNEYTVDLINAKYSFGKVIDKYLNILSSVDEIEILNQIEKYPIKGQLSKCQNIGLYFKEREKLLIGLKESYLNTKNFGDTKNSPDIIKILSKFFKFNNMYDEKNLYKFNVKTHIRGLRFSEIKGILEERGFSINEIISGLMYHYNLGAATIDFLYNYDENDNIIGINMHWRSGEQSYKCISQTYVPIVYFESMYRSLFSNKIADFLYERLVEIAIDNYRIWDIPFNRSDLEKYCSVKDNVYNAFDIEKYSKREEYRYLCYIGKQMQQYALRGYILEDYYNIKVFKEKLFDFMSKHTDDEMLTKCQRILFCERNTEA